MSSTPSLTSTYSSIVPHLSTKNSIYRNKMRRATTFRRYIAMMTAAASSSAPEGARGKRNEQLPKGSSSSGFSKTSKGAQKKRETKAAKGFADALQKQGFKRVSNLQEFEKRQKSVVPVILEPNAYAVFKYDESLFLTDAACPPYKFPLTDASVTMNGDGQVVVEEPLTGSVFDLATGKPLLWCPNSGFNPVRAVFGALKKQEEPENLNTYEVRITEDGQIWGKLP